MLRSFTACTYILRQSSSSYCVARRIPLDASLPFAALGNNPRGMPMKRATSNDLPHNAKLPTQAEARAQKQRSRWGVWEFYKYNLKAQPVLTKGLTCFFGGLQ